MSKNDGGPAFPQMLLRWNDTFEARKDGMTLRDAFALTAPIDTKTVAVFLQMSGLDGSETVSGEQMLKEMAAIRYAYADAMIAERDKK